ncbi:(2Fe-2S) ferredoxin domain-containing protein [Roseobacter sp. HKCCD9010]|nr:MULTISPECIES: (2Fe-2S) ferredoxin domain-containing protein [unclassified Roseobacter]MBF9052108.1 (2Fe-2S) ferredoxin domain-containing protein [Rhodobacterales bacterium HKCCD4356]NNW51605.1 (2Fe-2S) ferredoxin domain-containing protein [Roseobacter sp. HKCCD9144]NNW60142.1 (2Fe-2S) ferredoxin domain-containing protein [Roseobacter sp. HKCCD8629]NNW94242.1 (2Fe-2S) ferredoxin domain-containing protein [Roseobacter sp. HKCCD9063]NNY43283.1 (2Fe-2S) ferredoxin domain-containing protein [Ros
MDATQYQLTEATDADAILFVVSAYSLSKGALDRLEAAATRATSRPARLIRLEETSPSLIDALDTMRAEGHRRIRVQPLGIPFPEGLLTWLPGVVADWRTRGENGDTCLELGADPAHHADALAAFTASSLAHPDPAKPIEGVAPRLGKPGWNDPPDFEFHLLVCTGPRCAIHGAASFTHMLKDELKAAGVFDRCLTTRTGCIYPCNRGPVLALYPHGHWYQLPDVAATRRFVREVLVNGGTADDLRFHTARAARATQATTEETTL